MNQATRKYFVIALLLLNIIIRLTFTFHPFWGLEYEDAFIFNDTARQLAHDYTFSNDFFLTCSCISGTIEFCPNMDSFGGHFITFPIVLYCVNSLVGYSPLNIFYLNLCVVSILLYILSDLHKKFFKTQFSLEIFLALMMATPFISIFNTSGLSETFSSVFVTLSVISLYAASKDDFSPSQRSFWLSMALVLFTFIIKRENLILFFLILLIPFLRFAAKQTPFTSGYWGMFSVILLGALLSFRILNILSIETNESTNIHAATFSLQYVAENAWNTIRAMLQFRLWGITGIAFFFSIFWLVFKGSYSDLGLYCLCTALLYFCLYASHYRSYYQIHYHHLSPFESLRYSTNYFPLLALFIASNTYQVLITGKTYGLLTAFSLILIFLLIFITIDTREDLYNSEFDKRIEPVKRTLSIASQSDIIITDIPIVFHCFAPIRQKIIALYTLTNPEFDSLINFSKVNVFLCVKRTNPEDFKRYNFQLNTGKYCSIDIKLFNDQYQLLKFQKCY